MNRADRFRQSDRNATAPNEIRQAVSANAGGDVMSQTRRKRSNELRRIVFRRPHLASDANAVENVDEHDNRALRP